MEKTILYHFPQQVSSASHFESAEREDYCLRLVHPLQFFSRTSEIHSSIYHPWWHPTLYRIAASAIHDKINISFLNTSIYPPVPLLHLFFPFSFLHSLTSFSSSISPFSLDIYIFSSSALWLSFLHFLSGKGVHHCANLVTSCLVQGELMRAQLVLTADLSDPSINAIWSPEDPRVSETSFGKYRIYFSYCFHPPLSQTYITIENHT